MRRRKGSKVFSFVVVLLLVVSMLSSVMFAVDEADAIAVTVVDTETGNESNNDISVSLDPGSAEDTTAPTGTITVGDREYSTYDTEELSYEQVSATTLSVSINAADEGGGIKSIEYHIENAPLIDDILENITDWQNYDVPFDLEPSNTYVIYVKLTDNAGNVAYINTKMITVDNEAPIIDTGDRDEFYGDIYVQVTDLNIASILFDGTEMGAIRSLYGNPRKYSTSRGFWIMGDNAEHTIIATDKAGNTTVFNKIVYANYTVTYVADGETVSTQTVGYGKDASAPEIPTKEGYDETAPYWDDDGTGITEDKTITAVYTPNAKQEETQSEESEFIRLYGNTRYDTSISIADSMKETLGVDKFDNVVISSGEGFADALAGSYLANKKNAPIITVNSSTETKMEAYIKANLTENGTAYILGGTGVVSQSFENKLKNDGITVKRLAGPNRYDTNLAILKECNVDKEDLLVCSGTGYADSLSASASGKAILIVGNSLTSDQTAYLKSIDVNSLYIIGGTGAVNSSVEKAVSKYGTVKRLAGATRYETSIAVAEEFYGSDCNTVVLAYGQNFPDGLCGGPLAYTLKAPLILTQDGASTYSKAKQFVADNSVSKIYVLGGSALISDATVKAIMK